MDTNFWRQRWRDNDIPFHEVRVNAYLKTHFHRLGAARDGKVFVPLCGKALDMMWIRSQGVSVIGVELSSVAVSDFFSENGLDYVMKKSGTFQRFEADGIELLCGDFFDMSSSDFENVRSVYDRASYIALDFDGRKRYAKFIRDMLPAGAGVLLLTLEYSQSIMEGPPFSVDEAEVRGRFEERFDVLHLETRDIIDKQPRFRAKGLPTLLAHAFLLTDR